MKELNFFRSRTESVAVLFENWHNEFKNSSDNRQSRSRYCRLFDAFEEREKRDRSIQESGITTFHNCVGCNIEEGCLNILDFVRGFAGTDKIRTYLTIYTLLFYTLAERLGVIYKELGNGQDFEWSKFTVLRDVKHWANFFKHPKAYMFLHHPGYFLENDPNQPNFMISDKIDSAFVGSFYKAKQRNKDLRKLLENKKGWNVIFPDLLQFTKDLCAEVDKACDFILRPENVEALRIFTLKDY